MLSVSTASGSKILQQRMHLARAVADRAVDLADHDCAAVAVEDPAGPSQSAPKLTKQPMVRSGPTRRAIASSFSPFWAESTKPSAARCGASASSAASVCCAFTARTMRR